MWGSAQWIIDGTWRVCADASTMPLASALRASQLRDDEDAPDSAYQNELDGFPRGVTASLVGMCTLDKLSKTLVLRNWGDLPDVGDGQSKDAYELAFPELIAWRDRLDWDPQSYVITYDPVKKQILIAGGSAQGVLQGLVAFLRDSDHRLKERKGEVVAEIAWTTKHVLDYPEMKMRISSFKQTNFAGDTPSTQWRNAVTWNRYTHVHNDTQLFSLIEQERADPTRADAHLDYFNEMATFFETRHIRLIPRLYAGQASLPDPGPAMGDAVTLVEPWFSGPDITGLLPSFQSGAGIHLTEGMRVPLSPNTPLYPPETLAPVPAEKLVMTRMKGCTYLEKKQGQNPPDLALDHQTSPGGNTFVDCRTDDLGQISLCKDGDLCPTVGGAFGNSLAINPSASGTIEEVGTIRPQGGSAYSFPSGYEAANSTPYAFRPGHVYVLAIRYRLSQAGAGTAGVNYYAAFNPHRVVQHTDDQYLLPTGNLYDWATLVFRAPEPEVMTLNTTASAVHAGNHAIHIFSEGDWDAGNDNALHIASLQLFDLGDTVAYPVVDNYAAGTASAAGFPGAAYNATMDMLGWSPYQTAYPQQLVVRQHSTCNPAGDANCVRDALGWHRLGVQARLNLPTTNRANGVAYSGGSYRTVLTPGLWPRATAKADPTPALYPSELMVGQNFDRAPYWEPSPFLSSSSGKYYLSDGYLGVQLASLRDRALEHPYFFERGFVDVTHTYTEAKGFNRSQGLTATPQSNFSRVAQLNCRLQQALEQMGYDGEIDENYVPSRPQGIMGSGCQTNLQSSLLYYGDMFTTVHNATLAYNAPHGGGLPWRLATSDPFASGEFPVVDGSPSITMAPWWYNDDPEFIQEYYDDLTAQGFPLIFWMGSASAAKYASDYHRQRGGQREMARLAAAHPEMVYGAATYYNPDFAAYHKRHMTPSEERAWEQVTADCMWNPRWKTLEVVEMKPEDVGLNAASCLSNPRVECIHATIDADETDGLYYGYGPSGRLGSVESVRIKVGKTALLSPISIDEDTPSTTRSLMLRLFAKAESPYKRIFRLWVNGTMILDAEAPYGHFGPVEATFTLPASTSELSLSISNLGTGGLLVDGLTLYEELPHFGFDAAGLPLFPSDVDERASDSGWKYCDDLDYLDLGVQP